MNPARAIPYDRLNPTSTRSDARANKKRIAGASSAPPANMGSYDGGATRRPLEGDRRTRKINRPTGSVVAAKTQNDRRSLVIY
jgi:hypothetical protein